MVIRVSALLTNNNRKKLPLEASNVNVDAFASGPVVEISFILGALIRRHEAVPLVTQSSDDNGCTNPVNRARRGL